MSPIAGKDGKKDGVCHTTRSWDKAYWSAGLSSSVKGYFGEHRC